MLRQTPTGKLRIDRAALAAEAKLDGKFLLRTSDESLTAEDIALGYKALYEAERGWRDLKSTIDMRPVHHRREDRIESHVQLCWLAPLLLRVAETETNDTWRNPRNELDRMHLVTLSTNEGTVAQRTELTHHQRQILKALELPEPPRFYDCTPATSTADWPSQAATPPASLCRHTTRIRVTGIKPCSRPPLSVLGCLASAEPGSRIRGVYQLRCSSTFRCRSEQNSDDHVNPFGSWGSRDTTELHVRWQLVGPTLARRLARMPENLARPR